MSSLPALCHALRGFPGAMDAFAALTVCSGMPKVLGWGCSFGAKGFQILTRDVAGLQGSRNPRQNGWELPG